MANKSTQEGRDPRDRILKSTHSLDIDAYLNKADQRDGEASPDARFSEIGELYEDVHDIFRMARRSSTLIIKHSLKISHANAARIMEQWWQRCRSRQ